MRILLPVLILLFSNISFADIDPHFSNLCRNAAKISELGPAGLPIVWPSYHPAPPYGGIVTGAMSNTNPLIEICELVNKFNTWSDQQKFFGAKTFLNKLTDNKFKEQSDMVDASFNLLMSTMDYQSAVNSKGYARSASEQRRMNEDMKEMHRLFNNSRMNKAEEIYYQQELSQRTQKIQQVSAEREYLKDLARCPSAPQGNSQNKKILAEIEEASKLMQQANRDAEYYYERLYEMGQAMADGRQVQAEFYLKNLDFFKENIVTYDATEIRTKRKETVVPDKKRKNKDGTPVIRKEIIEHKYRFFKAAPNGSVANNFRNSYSKNWTDYVNYTLITQPRLVGVFAGATERLENRFRNMRYECREERLMGSKKPTDGDYTQVLKEKEKKCYEGLKYDEKTISNLFEYYLREIENSKYQEFNNQAKIWNAEAEHFEIYRLPANSEVSFQKKEVRCEKNLSQAESKMVQAKLASLENEYKGIILNENLKELDAETKREQAEKEFREAQNKKIRQDEERNKANKKQDAAAPGILPRKGGFGR